jgi:cell division septation protein DedD
MSTDRRFLAAAIVLTLSLALAACSRVADDWRAAQAADSAEAYQEFMQQHPGSEYAVQAQERIKQLAEDRDWQQASTLDTRDAYEQFVAQHADGKWAQEARVRIENFQLAPPPDAAAAVPMPATVAVPKPATVTSEAPKPASVKASTTTRRVYYAQLGAFSTRAGAETEWQRLRKKFPSQLGSLQPHYDAGKSQSKAVYRLKVGAGSEQRARDICAALKKQSQGCVPVAG